MYISEAATRGVPFKKVFLEILQNSQENTCARVSFFDKVAGLRLATLLRKDTRTKVFSCEFWEFSNNTFFTEYLQAIASVYFFSGNNFAKS